VQPVGRQLGFPWADCTESAAAVKPQRWLLHRPCQHPDKGDDDTRDPLATHEARSCEGQLLIPLRTFAHDDKLDEPPLLPRWR
jgi:hypothetical protein